jgi:hypothetical protein
MAVKDTSPGTLAKRLAKQFVNEPFLLVTPEEVFTSMVAALIRRERAACARLTKQFDSRFYGPEDIAEAILARNRKPRRKR